MTIIDFTQAPPKYVFIDRVMQLNPEYQKWMEAQSKTPATTVTEPEIALPIISNMDDYQQLNQGIDIDIPLTGFTTETMTRIQEPEFCLDAGLQVDTALDDLGSIFNKYEIPLGLLSKLMILNNFESLEFIIDDSGSMGCHSDTFDPLTGKVQTRWQEARKRLKEMIEILAYLPISSIGIEFLNRSNRIVLTSKRINPNVFLSDAYSQIDAVFAQPPAGTTPALEKIQQSIKRGQGMKVSRYFFGDGVPNGGLLAQEKIIKLLKHRTNPVDNPIAFISCTNEDDQVEWMKDAEEVIPYCSELDDLGDESREVLRDQGKALPFSKGFHLICQLVAAMCPEDLDAMDESVPLTKTTLDNLMGIESTEETYRHYFHHFNIAKQNRRIEGPADRIKKNIHWNYNDFLATRSAIDIPQVIELKQMLARTIQNEQIHQQRTPKQIYQQQTPKQIQPDDALAECCIIL